MRQPLDVDDAVFGTNGSQPAATVLDEYRVDLFELLDRGIPTPQYVPGCDGFVRAGKRHLVPAPAGTGKSLAWLRIAVGIVQHGGSVVILDVENGADEYARRLGCILDVCGGLTPEQQPRLRYYEWPKLSLKWNAEQWQMAVGDADVVILDSSRMALSQVGLNEDKSDDYAEFVDAILLPLAKAGIATVVLDNTGHGETRARGSKSKEDLNEVVFEMSARGTIDLDCTGTLTLKLTRARFGGLHRKLEMRVGGGVYEMPQPVEDSYDEQGNWRPTYLMKRVSDVLSNGEELTLNEIDERTVGRREYKRIAVDALIREGYVVTKPGERGARLHALVRPYAGE